jgi:Tol biopolymer transport system component
MRLWRIVAAVLGLAAGLAVVTILFSPRLVGLERKFEEAPPRLVFLREVDGVTNLWAADSDGKLERISAEPQGVWDYSPIPGGRGVLLSAYAEDGSLDLVRLSAGGERSVVIDCGEDDCRDARWQPSGDLVAFERVPARSDSASVEVWLLDASSGASWPVDDGSLLEAMGFGPAGRYPRWSADGRYLSFFHPNARTLLIVDMEGGPLTMVPSNLEIMGDWSPEAYALAYSELSFGVVDPHVHEAASGEIVPHTEPSLYNHLVVTNVEGEMTADLSDGLEVDDGKPVWHPDGESLAVARTSTGAGRQIWLVDVDGASRALTDEPLVNHSAPSWSPDGRELAFMRRNVAELGGEPAVWLLDVESGKMNLVEEGTYLPGWLPG